MMVTGFDDDEQVQRIGTFQPKAGSGWLRGGLCIDDLRVANLGLTPHRCRRHLAVDPLGELLCLVGVQLVAEGRHLRCHSPLANDFDGVRLAQAFEVLRQQRRADAAEARFAMAGATVLPIQRLHAGSRNQRRGAGECRDQSDGGEALAPSHDALRILM